MRLNIDSSSSKLVNSKDTAKKLTCKRQKRTIASNAIDPQGKGRNQGTRIHTLSYSTVNCYFRFISYHTYFKTTKNECVQ